MWGIFVLKVIVSLIWSMLNLNLLGEHGCYTKAAWNWSLVMSSGFVLVKRTWRCDIQIIEKSTPQNWNKLNKHNKANHFYNSFTIVGWTYEIKVYDKKHTSE